MRIGTKLTLGFGGVLILFIIGIIVGVAGVYLSNNASNSLEERYKQLRAMDELKLTGTTLVLTYMDIIIDKEAGDNKLLREREQAISQLKKKVQDNRQNYLD